MYDVPLGILLLLVVLADSVVLLYSALRSINSMIFSEGEPRRVDGIVSGALCSLILLSLTSAFIGYALLGVVQ
ncbi:hypothetical protein [Thermococcus indicus]